MDTTRATPPRVRIATVAATIAIAATAGRLAVGWARRINATAERHDRAARELARAVGRLSMVERHDDELESATLAEIRQIKAFNGRLAAALDENNQRWGRRRDEAYADGYLAGAHAARRGDTSTPTVVRRRHRRRPPRP